MSEQKLREALREAVRIASDENGEVFGGNLIARETAIVNWKQQAREALSQPQTSDDSLEQPHADKVVETVTTTNTGTPITDYAAYYVSEEAHRLIFGEGGELCGEVVNAEVSRRLERKNAELRKHLLSHVVPLPEATDK